MGSAQEEKEGPGGKVDEELEYEGVQPKVAREPGQPSKEEIARHREAC